MELSLIISIATYSIAGLLFLGIVWFIIKGRKKNKKFEAKEASNKEGVNEKYAYRVTIADPFGSSIREVATFGAHKTRNEKGIHMLKNEDKKFEEFFPIDEKHEVGFTIDYVKSKLKALRTRKPKENENPLNIKSEIYKWEKIERHLEFPGGSFLKIDKDGTPHFLFVRYRSVFVPFKWDLDMTHIHAPAEPLVKDIIDSREEKRKKYIEKLVNMQQILGMTTIVIGLIMMCIGGYMAYKGWSMADETHVAELQQRIDMAPLICAELYGKAGENFLKSSENAVTSTTNAVQITNQIKKDIYEKDPIIKEQTTQVIN